MLIVYSRELLAHAQPLSCRTTLCQLPMPACAVYLQLPSNLLGLSLQPDFSVQKGSKCSVFSQTFSHLSYMIVERSTFEGVSKEPHLDHVFILTVSFH
jgi:hypothetical protein